MPFRGRMLIEAAFTSGTQIGSFPGDLTVVYAGTIASVKT